jgi:hypothetical protein
MKTTILRKIRSGALDPEFFFGAVVRATRNIRVAAEGKDDAPISMGKRRTRSKIFIIPKGTLGLIGDYYRGNTWGVNFKKYGGIGGIKYSEIGLYDVRFEEWM